MRFLIDAQLPPRLARTLAARGHDATHVTEIGLATATDADIWRAAMERAAVLITKDQDFAISRGAADAGPCIVWVRLGNTSNDVLIARLVNSLAAIEDAIARGEAVVEVVGREAE